MPGTPDPDLAVWREAREWWDGAPAVECRKRVDERGRRRVEQKTLDSLGLVTSTSPFTPEMERELRRGKIEDDKVAAACSQEAFIPRSVHTGPRQRTFGLLHFQSGYAFGRSVILAEEAGAFAEIAGCSSAAIADPFSLMGAHEFALRCEQAGVQPLIGASIELPEGGDLVLIARSQRGYRSLSRLITACHLEEPRGFPLANWERLARHADDLLCLTGGDLGPIDRLLARRDRAAALRLLERLIEVYGRNNVFLEVERSFLPWGRAVESQLLELAAKTGTVPVAGATIGMGQPHDFAVQDTLRCAESLCLIEEIYGRKPRRHDSQPSLKPYPERALNAERYVRNHAQMRALFTDCPELLENTLRLADRCDRKVFPPRAPMPNLFENDAKALQEIVEHQAKLVYGTAYGVKQRKRLDMEVRQIQKMGYASHFLIAWDFCRWAHEQGVGLSGRGSVVDSAVAYVLGFSRIDAIEHRLHFDRFLPGDGSKRPDIDIDFEARRRDDVRAYITRRYGKERVAGLAAIGSYRARRVVRDVGKVFGLPDDAISYLAKRIHGGVSAERLEEALLARPELRDAKIPREKFRWIFALAKRLQDVPNGLGLHSSGVIVSATPLEETVPVQWSASPVAPDHGIDDPFVRMIQWDKRTAKHFFDKFDVLCLRGQDILAGVEAKVRGGNIDFSVTRLEAVNDPEVYRAMRSGELIGIPQSASPAMRQAHQRLRTNTLHEASMVQAGIRPGVGGAVKLNELIARHRGKDYTLEHPDLEEILGNTYGIIVFQEQVDQILAKFCGYSPGEAEEIRDAIYKRRRDGYADQIRDQIIQRAVDRGYTVPVAQHIFELVGQFKGYGFAQGHALAFAEVSLRSVFLMQNYPASYFAALLSSQPAGYYGPCTIANEARGRGIRLLGLDVNCSRERFEVEDTVDSVTGIVVPQGAIRVGLMQLSGLSEPTRTRILEHQNYLESVSDRTPITPPDDPPSFTSSSNVQVKSARDRLPPAPLLPFGSLFDFVVKVQPARDELEALILTGGFDRLEPNRRALLNAMKLALDFAALHRHEHGHPVLPLDYVEPKLDRSLNDFNPAEKAVHERAYLGMDVAQHLVAFERERVLAKGGVTTQEARRLLPGTRTFVVGNPIRLRFPPTQSGRRVVFFDLEDETGLLNCTAFDRVYQQYGHAIVCSQYATVQGTVQDRDGHAAFMVERVWNYQPQLMRGILEKLPVGSADFLVG